MQLSTEDIISAFTVIAEDMSNPHWALGDKLVELTTDQGFSKEFKEQNADIINKSGGFKIGYLTKIYERVFGKGRSAALNHYRTSLIFPADMRALEINWALHERCGRAVKDVRKQADYKKAHDWLNKVAGGGYTYDTLTDAMKGNQDDQHKPDPVYLCKRAEAVVRDIVGYQDSDLMEVTLHISAADLENIPAIDEMFSSINIPILLTMFIPAQVQVHEHSEEAA